LNSLHHSPLSSLLHSLNSFNRFHFSIYLHVYTVFVPYSPSYTLDPLPLPSPLVSTLRQDLFHPPVLWFCKRKKWHFYLFMIAIQGVSLWHFLITWFLLSIFSYHKVTLIKIIVSSCFCCHLLLSMFPVSNICLF
jgi:hypothetical protein